MIAILVGLMLQSVYAEDPSTVDNEKVNATIVVEAHRALEVYVAPIEMSIHSSAVEAIVSDKSVFSYTNSFWRNAKVKNKRGTWEPIIMHNDVNVYDKDTIKYAWDDCDYVADHKKCGYKNNHMTVETFITIDDHQIAVDMILFGPDLTVINQSTYTSQSKVNWIRQQEVTVIQQQGMLGSQTMMNKPKEELPLKWLIPTNLMNKHIHQASLGLWTGAKID